MKIGIIGYGSMGRMLLEKFIGTKTVEQSNLYVSNRTHEKIARLNNIYPEVHVCNDNISAAQNADMLFVCVKTLEMKAVLLEINKTAKENCHIVSMNGSVLLGQMGQICANRKITRIIPTVTAEVNQAITLVCHNDYVSRDDKNAIKRLMECFGTVTELPEAEISMCAELTSCMPGFIGAMFKVVAVEARKHTAIGEPQIIQMVTQTLYGTAKLLLEKQMTFDALISRVATKGGITEEGAKIIAEKLPATVNELFEKTLEKRRITTEQAQNDFGK